jgi:hypothetical protein
MATRSIEGRLQKLELAHQGAGRFIVMQCQAGGSMEGAAAFFKGEAGVELQRRDDLVLLHRFGESECRAELPSLYEILAHLDPGGISQVVREFDRKARRIIA